MTIGEYLRDIRKARGLSQQELGDRVGMVQPVISRLENNERVHFDAGELYSILAALDCDDAQRLRALDLAAARQPDVAA
jgi:transcriptional regulator with XRE-family HTH domain